MDIPLADHSLEGIYKEEDSSDWRELSTFQHWLQKIQWKHCLYPRGKKNNWKYNPLSYYMNTI